MRIAAQSNVVVPQQSAPQAYVKREKKPLLIIDPSSIIPIDSVLNHAKSDANKPIDTKKEKDQPTPIANSSQQQTCTCKFMISNLYYLFIFC